MGGGFTGHALLGMVRFESCGEFNCLYFRLFASFELRTLRTSTSQHFTPSINQFSGIFHDGLAFSTFKSSCLAQTGVGKGPTAPTRGMLILAPGTCSNTQSRQ